MSNYKSIDAMLGEIQKAQETPSNMVPGNYPPITATTMDPGGMERTAEYIFNYEIPRIAEIASSLEKQAELGADNPQYLLAMAYAMREKVASEAAQLIKEAGCGCGCNDCSGSYDIADHLLDYSIKVSGVKKKYQSSDGGLNRKGRAHFKRTEGANLKRPVSKKQAKKSPKSAKRRKSFCARMGGMKKKHNIDCSKTPDKSICKALRKWDC